MALNKGCGLLVLVIMAIFIIATGCIASSDLPASPWLSRSSRIGYDVPCNQYTVLTEKHIMYAENGFGLYGNYTVVTTINGERLIVEGQGFDAVPIGVTVRIDQMGAMASLRPDVIMWAMPENVTRVEGVENMCRVVP